MKAAIFNYGCVNEEAMYDNLMSKMEQQGIESAEKIDESDYIIVITCGGVGETISRIANDLMVLNSYSKKNNTKVIVVGCLVSRLKEEMSALFDLFEDNPNMKLIDDIEWIMPVINYMCETNMITTDIEKLYNRTHYLDRDGINIQFIMEWGCTNKCSFCKTNYMNFTPVSVPYELALNYLRNMVINNGTKVICLNGMNLTLYGIDLYGKPRLHEFIHELSKIKGLERININELVPGNMYKELLDEIITNPKVVRTSFQLETASNRLLNLMNRNYTLEEYDYYVKRVIDSGRYVSTIIMSGFPTETEDDMNYTIRYLKDRGIITEVISEYVDFKGIIPSSKLEQYSKREKRRHTKYLSDNLKEINYDIYLQEMPNQTTLISAVSKDGKQFFHNDIPMIITVPGNNRFRNIKPGTIITEAPKRLVKHNNIAERIAYKVG